MGKPMPCWQKERDNPESSNGAEGLPYGERRLSSHTILRSERQGCACRGSRVLELQAQAYVGLDKFRGQCTQVVLDAESGPNLVREDFLTPGGSSFGTPSRSDS